MSWAIARKAVKLSLPMSTDTLEALTWDLVTHAASASLIETLWHAIQACHPQYHPTPPIDGRGELTAWKRSIASVTGRPLSLKLPIHRTVVVRLLAWRPTQVAWNRARLATALATIACLRISEVAHLQVRDLWFDHFTGYGIRVMKGPARYTSTSARMTGFAVAITRRWGVLRTRNWILCTRSGC